MEINNYWETRYKNGGNSGAEYTGLDISETRTMENRHIRPDFN